MKTCGIGLYLVMALQDEVRVVQNGSHRRTGSLEQFCCFSSDA